MCSSSFKVTKGNTTHDIWVVLLASTIHPYKPTFVVLYSPVILQTCTFFFLTITLCFI